MLLPIKATVDAVPSFGPMSLWVTCLICWLKLLTKRSETKPKTFGRLQNGPRFATTLNIFELLWSRVSTKVMALQCCAHLMIEMGSPADQCHFVSLNIIELKSSALPVFKLRINGRTGLCFFDGFLASCSRSWQVCLHRIQFHAERSLT